MNKRRIGGFYEDLACNYIKQQGGTIIERNYRAFRGEIDIIARDEGYICFVEVKYRTGDNFGYPEEAVTFSKKKQICKISKLYLYAKYKSLEFPIRYDVIALSGSEAAITIKWYKNAFDYV